MNLIINILFGTRGGFRTYKDAGLNKVAQAGGKPELVGLVA